MERTEQTRDGYYDLRHPHFLIFYVTDTIIHFRFKQIFIIFCISPLENLKLFSVSIFHHTFVICFVTNALVLSHGNRLSIVLFWSWDLCNGANLYFFTSTLG